MKILVPTKRVPDTDQKIRLRADGRGIDTNDLPFIVNPFDAIAVEEALRIREAATGDVEVVVLGIGSPDYEPELRSSLAMGADRAIRVATDLELDPWNIARILQELVKRQAPDLVLMGKQAVDDDSNQVGQFLAALLDWPQATFASGVEFTSGESLRVRRETDLGIEVVGLDLPAIVTTDLRLNEPRFASVRNILKARKAPIEQIEFDELGLEVEPRVQVLALETDSSERNCVRLDSPEELLRHLREEVKVIK